MYCFQSASLWLFQVAGNYAVWSELARLLTRARDCLLGLCLGPVPVIGLQLATSRNFLNNLMLLFLFVPPAKIHFSEMVHLLAREGCLEAIQSCWDGSSACSCQQNTQQKLYRGSTEGWLWKLGIYLFLESGWVLKRECGEVKFLTWFPVLPWATALSFLLSWKVIQGSLQAQMQTSVGVSQNIPCLKVDQHKAVKCILPLNNFSSHQAFGDITYLIPAWGVGEGKCCWKQAVLWSKPSWIGHEFVCPGFKPKRSCSAVWPSYHCLFSPCRKGWSSVKRGHGFTHCINRGIGMSLSTGLVGCVMMHKS